MEENRIIIGLTHLILCFIIIISGFKNLNIKNKQKNSFKPIFYCLMRNKEVTKNKCFIPIICIEFFLKFLVVLEQEYLKLKIRLNFQE